MAWPNRNAVLVPVDFSEASFAAVNEALSMVKSPSDVHVIHVVPSLASEADFVHEALEPGMRESHAEAVVAEHLTEEQRGVDIIVRSGKAGDVIAAAATELGCDLIVIPSHGRSGLSRMLLGSVTERVLRLATIPVLVLRAS